MVLISYIEPEQTERILILHLESLCKEQHREYIFVDEFAQLAIIYLRVDAALMHKRVGELINAN
jgi:hypothetical protein